MEETGAHIDDETESPLSTVNNESPLWTITDVTEHVHRDHVKPSAINDHGMHDKDKSDIPQTVKKKKILKARKSSKCYEISLLFCLQTRIYIYFIVDIFKGDELTCPQCDRSFHHKNSLVYHMRSHSGERPHQCEVCGKSFFAASALKVRQLLHRTLIGYYGLNICYGLNVNWMQ